MISLRITSRFLSDYFLKGYDEISIKIKTPFKVSDDVKGNQCISQYPTKLFFLFLPWGTLRINNLNVRNT